MYLRFAEHEIDDDSGHELGVFHAVGYLREEGKLHSHEEAQPEAIRAWFNENLEKPTRFTASKLSIESRTKLYRGARIRPTTDRVGYVVYEDDFQTVAKPFAGERYSREKRPYEPVC